MALATLLGDDEQMDAAIVGDKGQVYLTGMPESGQLQVQWGPQKEQQCKVTFTLGKPQLSDSSHFTAMKQVDAVCE